MPHNKVDRLRYEILLDHRVAIKNHIPVLTAPPSDAEMKGKNYSLSYLYLNEADSKGWRNDAFRSNWDCRTHWTYPMGAKLRRKIDKKVLDEFREIHRWATQLNPTKKAVKGSESPSSWPSLPDVIPSSTSSSPDPSDEKSETDVTKEGKKIGGTIIEYFIKKNRVTKRSSLPATVPSGVSIPVASTAASSSTLSSNTVTPDQSVTPIPLISGGNIFSSDKEILVDWLQTQRSLPSKTPNETTTSQSEILAGLSRSRKSQIQHLEKWAVTLDGLEDETQGVIWTFCNLNPFFRPQRTFSSFTQLIQQLKEDAESERAYWTTIILFSAAVVTLKATVHPSLASREKPTPPLSGQISSPHPSPSSSSSLFPTPSPIPSPSPSTLNDSPLSHHFSSLSRCLSH